MPAVIVLATSLGESCYPSCKRSYFWSNISSDIMSEAGVDPELDFRGGGP